MQYCYSGCLPDCFYTRQTTHQVSSSSSIKIELIHQNSIIASTDNLYSIIWFSKIPFYLPSMYCLPCTWYNHHQRDNKHTHAHTYTQSVSDTTRVFVCLYCIVLFPYFIFHKNLHTVPKFAYHTVPTFTYIPSVLHVKYLSQVSKQSQSFQYQVLSLFVLP